MSTKLFTLVLLLPSIVSAANNWNTPCLSGTCSYDLHNSSSPHGAAGGSIYINGSTSAISDLTPAAGWTILDCNATTAAQDIRAVCTGDNNACSHLYTNGAIGTVVRLPENCGKMPFARIASEWQHEDQSVPPAVAQKLRRRDGQPSPTVRGISLDTSFSKIDPNHHGHVSMFLQGATGSAANTTALAPPPSARELEERGFFSSIKNAVQHAVQAIEQTFSYDKTGATTLSVDKTVNLLNKQAQCAPSSNVPAFTAGVSVNVEAKADATINYGLAISGTIVPPKITEFGLVAGLDADLDGKLSLDVMASATMSTNPIMLFQVGLPGLDFPGILSVGPSFQVNAKASAALEADATLSLDLAYKASGARLYFPPNAGSSLGTFAPSDTNLQLSANPSVTATGNIQAHLLPTISFGLNALDGLAEVSVDLNLDASAQMTLTLSKSLNTAFSGCADISTGLGVNAVAGGDFFGLFNKNTVVPLYNHNWDLWKKCFGSQRREHTRAFPSLPKRDNLCAGVSPGAKQTMASQTIPANKVGAAN